jgi:hypothetical protein
MSSQKWLSWAPSKKGLSSGQEGTDKTDGTGGLSVLSVQGSGKDQTPESSGTDSIPQLSAPRSEGPVHPGVEVASLSQNVESARKILFDNSIAAEALHDVAGLLVIAYQRHQKVQRLR